MITNRRNLLASGSAATVLATDSLVASDDAKAQAAQPAVEWHHDADVLLVFHWQAGGANKMEHFAAGPAIHR
jgi:hypothetical protein